MVIRAAIATPASIAVAASQILIKSIRCLTRLINPPFGFLALNFLTLEVGYSCFRVPLPQREAA